MIWILKVSKSVFTAMPLNTITSLKFGVWSLAKPVRPQMQPIAKIVRNTLSVIYDELFLIPCMKP